MPIPGDSPDRGLVATGAVASEQAGMSILERVACGAIEEPSAWRARPEQWRAASHDLGEEIVVHPRTERARTAVFRVAAGAVGNRRVESGRLASDESAIERVARDARL